MGLWESILNLFSARGKALALYKSGIAKAKEGNYRGAIDDYTAAIEEPNIPLDVKGMATYNRALAYSAIDEEDKATEDLAAMLKMPGLPENIKTQAHQRRERIRRRSGSGEQA